MSEKYAGMMKSTSPEEYAQIEHLLSPLDAEDVSLIDKFAEIMLEWEEELKRGIALHLAKKQADLQFRRHDFDNLSRNMSPRGTSH